MTTAGDHPGEQDRAGIAQRLKGKERRELAAMPDGDDMRAVPVVIVSPERFLRRGRRPRDPPRVLHLDQHVDGHRDEGRDRARVELRIVLSRRAAAADTTVTLIGRVRSYEERNPAESTAWSSPHVERVVNDIVGG